MKDKASLQAQVTELEEKVKGIQKERNDARDQAYQAGVERDNAREEVAQLRAALAKERTRQAAAGQAAWEKQKADHRAKVAADARAEEVRKEVEKAREEVEKRRIEAIRAAEAQRSGTQTAAEKLAALKASRERAYRGARHTYTESVPDPADELLEAELEAEVAAEEREKMEAKAREEKPETEEEKQIRLAKQRHDDFWFGGRNG
jgi:colicin import membrane protein